MNLDLNELSESINWEETPEQLKRFYVGENQDFFVKLKLLGLTQENDRFVHLHMIIVHE